MDKTNSLRLVAGLALMLVSGCCHTPYSYNPYGYSGAHSPAYPGFPTYPGATYPGTTYPGTTYPGTTYPGSVPGTVYPGAIPGAVPGATYPPGQPLMPGTQPGMIETTPLYTPGNEWGPANGSVIEDTIPDTYDGGSIDPVPQPQDPLGGNPMFDDKANGGDEVQSFGSSEPAAEDFARPVASNVSATTARRSPEYDYDKEYRWLKGVLHRDQTTNELHIVYSFGGTDKYKGDLPLAQHPKLRNMPPSQPVEVFGSVQASTDGRPIYVVTDIRSLDVPEVR